MQPWTADLFVTQSSPVLIIHLLRTLRVRDTFSIRRKRVCGTTFVHVGGHTVQYNLNMVDLTKQALLHSFGHRTNYRYVPTTWGKGTGITL